MDVMLATPPVVPKSKKSPAPIAQQQQKQGGVTERKKRVAEPIQNNEKRIKIEAVSPKKPFERISTSSSLDEQDKLFMSGTINDMGALINKKIMAKKALVINNFKSK
jgi:hypothetical protein